MTDSAGWRLRRECEENLATYGGRLRAARYPEDPVPDIVSEDGRYRFDTPGRQAHYYRHPNGRITFVGDVFTALTARGPVPSIELRGEWPTEDRPTTEENDMTDRPLNELGLTDDEPDDADRVRRRDPSGATEADDEEAREAPDPAALAIGGPLTSYRPPTITVNGGLDTDALAARVARAVTAMAPARLTGISSAPVNAEPSLDGPPSYGPPRVAVGPVDVAGVARVGVSFVNGAAETFTIAHTPAQARALADSLYSLANAAEEDQR